MIGTIRKHSKWLWIVIITITIATFIFWGSASNSGGRNRNYNFGTIDNEPVTQEAYVSAAKEAWLAFFLNYGANPNMKFDEQRGTYDRLFWLKKLKDYNIHVDDAATFRVAQEFLQTNNVTLDKLNQAFGGRADLTDFERFLRHNLGIDQLMSVLGLSSDLITTQEVKALYLQHYQELATEAVFFSATNFESAVVAPSPEALQQFYQQHLAEYHLSERVQVRFVKVDPTNFLADADQQIAKITNFMALLDAEYLKRGTNYYPHLTPAEAKKQMLQEQREIAARGFARKKADALADALSGMKPQHPSNIVALAANNGLQVKTTAPFEEQTGPAEQDLGLNFGRAAFALTPEDPVSEQPVEDGDAYFILSLEKRLPSEILTLDRIHDRVVADYKRYQALQLARRAARQFAESATNNIAKGKTFDAIAAESKVKAVSVPPISLSTRTLPEVEDHLSTYEFQRIAFGTPVGKVAEPVLTPEGAVVVYVRQLLPIDEAKMKADLPQFYKNVRLARRQEAIGLWLQREREKSMRNTPLAEPAAAPPGARRS
jgi:parvulin-like peptidyl-prolyl isomerase